MKFTSLPRPLIALLFAYPVFALPTTRHDPFRAIALKEPKLEQEQICYLISPPPTEPQPTEDELLLSFEDWKAKLLSEGKSGSATGPSGDADASGTDPIQAVDGSENGNHEGGSVEGKDDRTDPSLLPHEIPTDGQPSSQDQADFVPGEPISPHFRVPLTDRFNYASMECSARIHKAHKSAKSAASILSSKKDRYMLSPCATKTADGKEENHFVIVELCEDIRIDTVQLANFEFFSGVFRDFTVSVAKTYTPDVPEWTTVGTYRARNIRGVQVRILSLGGLFFGVDDFEQSFHLPTSLRDFYRYIRIDFHSHYGSEFYCPVSLLRVYGLTHLEEWKWDTQANRYEQLQVPASPQANPDPTSAIPVEAASETVSVTQTIHPTPEPTLEGGRARAKTDIQPPSITEPTSTPQCVQASGGPLPLVNTEPIPTTDPLPPQSSSVISHSPSDVTQSTLVSTPQTTEVASSVPVRSPPPVSPSQATPVISLGSQALISPHHAGTGGGENIYRTIMNRITMLELNATLHARYVEEQTVGVREVLKRLAEEIGRLEGIVRRLLSVLGPRC